MHYSHCKIELKAPKTAQLWTFCVRSVCAHSLRHACVVHRCTPSVLLVLTVSPSLKPYTCGTHNTSPVRNHEVLGSTMHVIVTCIAMKQVVFALPVFLMRPHSQPVEHDSTMEHGMVLSAMTSGCDMLFMIHPPLHQTPMCFNIPTHITHDQLLRARTRSKR
jgi:hypothetical protein